MSIASGTSPGYFAPDGLIRPKAGAFRGVPRVPITDLTPRPDEPCSAGRVISYVRDQEIYGEGDDATRIFRVKSGVVRTCKFLSDGRRQVEAFYRVGTLFGFQGATKYFDGASATCACTIIAYRRLPLETLSECSDRLSLQLFSLAMTRLSQAHEHALSLGRHTAIEKVAHFLVDFSDGPCDEVIDLPMARRDIADYLGLTIETVSRVFSHLERAALIETRAAHQVRLRNLAALQALCV